MDALQPDRVEWVDTAKGLGIALVVFGHVERGLFTSQAIQQTAAISFADAWIYSFHMPMFFFLSGLFLFRSATRMTFKRFAADKIRTIAYPYFVWSIIVVLLKSLSSDLPNKPRGPDDLLTIPIEPIEQFWFLYVLFILVMLFGFLFALGAKPWMTVALAALLHPAVIPYLSNWSIMNEARGSAIYIALGALVGQSGYFKEPSGKPFALALVAIAGLAFPALVVWSGSGGKWIPALAISGTIGIAAASMLIHGFDKIMRATNYMGRNTLEIYVSHTIFSAAARIILLGLSVQSSILHLAAGTIAGIAGPLAIAFLFKMANFRFGFTFPKANPLSRLR
jgi:fucose 4-O-acetylase-like acetyltransferase